MISVKHRRADEAEWLEYDPVIPDGELALVRYDTGYDLKIGDGVKRYSELAPLMGKLSYDEGDLEVHVNLSHRDRTVLSYPESIIIDVNHASHPDFVATLSFSTVDFPPEISMSDEDICISGTSVEDGYFIPSDFMHYTLLFWKDTRLNCHVRGVYVG